MCLSVSCMLTLRQTQVALSDIPISYNMGHVLVVLALIPFDKFGKYLSYCKQSPKLKRKTKQ